MSISLAYVVFSHDWFDARLTATRPGPRGDAVRLRRHDRRRGNRAAVSGFGVSLIMQSPVVSKWSYSYGGTQMPKPSGREVQCNYVFHALVFCI